MSGDLLISLILGLVGMAYFIYGKRESDLWFMLAGVALSFFPYVVKGIELQLVIGAALMYLPIYMVRYS